MHGVDAPSPPTPLGQRTSASADPDSPPENPRSQRFLADELCELCAKVVERAAEHAPEELRHRGEFFKEEVAKQLAEVAAMSALTSEACWLGSSAERGERGCRGARARARCAHGRRRLCGRGAVAALSGRGVRRNDLGFYSPIGSV